jgi:LEA14-like dessication related protein
MNVGQLILDVPFPEMVRQLALAIAEGQYALDMNSIEVAQALAETELPAESVIVAITETRDAEGNVTNIEPIYNEDPMPLLVYGLEPRFYEFSESIIEVKITITIRLERSVARTYDTKFSFKNRTEFSGSYKTSGIASLLFGKAKASLKNTTEVAYVMSYNAKYSQKYSYKAEGASMLRTVIRPVPAPPRVIPRLTVVEPTP